MARKNNLFIVIMISVLLIGGIYLASTNNLFAFSGVVYTPIYSNLWCADCGTDLRRVSEAYTGSGDNLEIVSECGITNVEQPISTYDFTGYYPNGCYYTLSSGGSNPIGELWYADCSASVDESTVLEGLNDNLGIGNPFVSHPNCLIADVDFNENPTIEVQLGHRFYVVSEVQMDYNSEALPFCLWVSGGDQSLSQFSTCSRSSLSSVGLSDWPGGIPEIVPIGEGNSIQNVVAGYQGTVNNVDIVESPTTGDDVYIQLTPQGHIEACPLRVAFDGVTYVEQISCYRDDNFVCVPSLLGTAMCPDGTYIQSGSEGESCDVSGDGFMGYFLIGLQKCPVLCVDNTIEIQNDQCVDIENPIIPGEYNSESGESSTIIFIFLAIIGALVLLIIVLLVMRRRSGGL